MAKIGKVNINKMAKDKFSLEVEVTGYKMFKLQMWLFKFLLGCISKLDVVSKCNVNFNIENNAK